MSRRYRYIDVPVELSEVLENIDDDDLIEELKGRRKGRSALEAMEERLEVGWFDRLRWLLLRGDVNGALAMVDSEQVQSLIAEDARAAQYAAVMGRVQ